MGAVTFYSSDPSYAPPQIRIGEVIKRAMFIIALKRMSRKTAAYYLKIIQIIFIS
jgi:hypothetical protein